MVQNLLTLFLQSIIDASITDLCMACRPAKKKMKFALIALLGTVSQAIRLRDDPAPSQAAIAKEENLKVNLKVVAD